MQLLVSWQGKYISSSDEKKMIYQNFADLNKFSRFLTYFYRKQFSLTFQTLENFSPPKNVTILIKEPFSL